MIISKAQKKIIVAAVIIIIVFLTFSIFIYSPRSNNVKRIKMELRDMEGQIQELERMVGKDKPLSEGLELLKLRYRRLSAKLPEKEEESLKKLSAFARKLNVEVISIRPSSKAPFLDKNKKEVMIEDKTLQQINMNLELECSYQNLVKYIEMLKEDLPGFINVETLQLIKNDVMEKNLNVKLRFKLYLLS